MTSKVNNNQMRIIGAFDRAAMDELESLMFTTQEKSPLLNTHFGNFWRAHTPLQADQRGVRRDDGSDGPCVGRPCSHTKKTLGMQRPYDQRRDEIAKSEARIYTAYSHVDNGRNDDIKRITDNTVSKIKAKQYPTI